MTWTIVIGFDLRLARSAAEEIVHSDIHSGAVGPSSLQFGTTRAVSPPNDYFIEWTSASLAPRRLEGARPDRIVIAGDYLSWSLPPGELTLIWGMIERTRIMRSVELVFA